MGRSSLLVGASDGTRLVGQRWTADPVNAGMAWLTPLLDRYAAAGVDVTTKVYDGGRHEMFNETNRDEVVADLIAWLDSHLP